MEKKTKEQKKLFFDDEDDLNKVIYEGAYNNALKDLVDECEEEAKFDKMWVELNMIKCLAQRLKK